jgi:hypothetical protein
MALSDIQTQVRFFAKDDNIDLTTEPGLSIANEVYRRVVRSKKHPEFRLRKGLEVQTLSGTSLYVWEIRI